MTWVRDRSLGILFLGLFLLTWIAQLVVQWLQFREDQRTHGERPEFWSSDFWVEFGQAKVRELTVRVPRQRSTRLLAERGISVDEVEKELPYKDRRTR